MTPHRRPRPSTAAVVVALLIVYIVWGSTYLGIAMMIETMPPLLAAGVRYVSAGVILLAFLVIWAWSRPPDQRPAGPTAANWRASFIIGGLLLLGGNGGVVLSELFIPSGIAAVLVASTPIWMAVFDALVTRQRPSLLVVGGLAAGIVGVVVLLVPVQGVAGLDARGVALALFAEFSWAAGSIYLRHASLPRSAALATGMEMLAGGALLVLTGALLGEVAEVDVATFSLRSIGAFVYLVLIGSVLAFSAYTWLLSNAPISTVSTYAYVNPIVAVALGAVILSEPITPRTLIASAIIIGAVVAMVSGRPRTTEEPGAAPEIASLESE